MRKKMKKKNTKSKKKKKRKKKKKLFWWPIGLSKESPLDQNGTTVYQKEKEGRYMGMNAQRRHGSQGEKTD